MRKGQRMSEEQKKKISKANKENPTRYWLGKKRSDETREKISKGHIGKEPWNKGKKGVMPEPWNKGKSGYQIHTEEHKKELSKKFKGRVSPMKGRTQSEHFFEVMNGKEPWNKGTKGIMKPNSTSFKKEKERNSNKKGYFTLHRLINKNKGKASNYICELCGEKQAKHWSNKDHKYKRDLNDWQALCPKCHFKWDKENNNLHTDTR